MDSAPSLVPIPFRRKECSCSGSSRTQRQKQAETARTQASNSSFDAESIRAYLVELMRCLTLVETSSAVQEGYEVWDRMSVGKNFFSWNHYNVSLHQCVLILFEFANLPHLLNANH